MLFSPDPNRKTYWVQCQLQSPQGRLNLSIRLDYSPGFFDPDGSFVVGGFTITDYRAPSHPFINWAWIDAHQKEIFQALELDA